MARIDGITESFSRVIRQRGEDYFESGAVSIYSIQPDCVEADVHGTSIYEVTLDRPRRSSNEISWRCTCPYFLESGPCKHIWASLLYLSEFEPNWLRLSNNTHGAPHADTDGYGDETSPRGLSESRPVVPRRASGDPDSTTLSPIGSPVSIRPKMWRAMLNACGTIEPNLVEEARELYEQEPTRSIVAFVLSVGESTLHQELVIESYYRFEHSKQKDGDTGPVKRLNFSKYETFDGFSRHDRQLLNLLSRSDIRTTTRSSSLRQANLDSFQDAIKVGYDVSDSVISQLIDSGKFYWQLASGTLQENAVLITNLDRSNWEFRPMIETHEAEQRWTMRGSLQCDQGAAKKILPFDQLPLVLNIGIAVCGDQVMLFNTLEERRAIDWFRRNGQVDVPFADQADLQLEVATHPIFSLIDLPEALRWDEVQSVPRGRFSIEPDEYHKSEIWINTDFVYDGQAVPTTDSRSRIVDWEHRRWILRDLEREAQWIDVLRAEPSALLNELAGNAHVRCSTEHFLPLTRWALSHGWEVVAMGRLVRNHGDFNLHVTSGLDWFDVHGEIEFDGARIALPELLQNADDRGMIKLDDGSHGILPEEWLARIRHLAAMGTIDADSITFQRSQGLWLDLLLAEKADATFDRGVRQFRQKLQKFDGVKPANPTRGFRGELRDYQKEGLGWLNFLRDFQFGGCLADDMGLGKTVQVLALLHARRNRRLKSGEQRKTSLVVVPKSLVHNWLDEGARFAPHLNLFDFTGTARKRRWKEVEPENADVMLTTYGTLRRDIEYFKDIEFEYAILDEANAIKNKDSQTAKCCRLLNAEHRLALTGTPVENHLGELWSLFEFLNPGILGQHTAFDQLARVVGDTHEQARWIGETLRPFILRRTKEQVLTELPDKTEMTLTLDLEPKQRKLYNELRDYYRALITKKVASDGLGRSKIHVLEALLRLRQVACHPALVSDDHKRVKSAKLEALFEHIEEITAEGHKALLFSQFTKLLGIVRKEFLQRGIDYEYLDGKTKDRRAVVDRFQNDPECQLFLISLKAGGHGLNLTAADYVFILDPWWNPAVEAQAVDRAHRIGQSRNVFAYRFICRDTVEQRIVELQDSKRELADAILTENNRMISRLSMDDIQMLLS